MHGGQGAHKCPWPPAGGLGIHGFQDQLLDLIMPVLPNGAPNPAYDDVGVNGTPDGRMAQREEFIRCTYIGAVSTLELVRPPSGGLRPYAADTYYGGAEWIPTTASLGWYYAEIGERRAAAQLLAWVASQADDQGHLPEQVCHSLNAPGMYASWVERWGPVARPLLWSHAK